MLWVDHNLLSYHATMLSCRQGSVGGAGGPDRREPMGGSEESQDHNEAAEYGDVEGLALPSWFLCSHSKQNICNWWFTGIDLALMSDSKPHCSVLIKTKAIKRSYCLTSELLYISLQATGGFNGFCNPPLGWSGQKNSEFPTCCAINVHRLKTSSHRAAEG